MASQRWRAAMEYYVGLDVSLKQTSICVVNQTGSIVQEGVVGSDPEAIASFVRSRAPGTVRIGIETGPTTTWLWTELNRLGLPVICIDARHAKAVLKMRSTRATATMRPALLASCRPAGSRRCASRISTATRSRRYWRAGRCWSRSNVILRTKFAACLRTSVRHRPRQVQCLCRAS